MWSHFTWTDGRVVVVDDFLLPHIQEARADWCALPCTAQLKGVHSRVKIGVAVVVGLHLVMCDISSVSGVSKCILFLKKKSTLGDGFCLCHEQSTVSQWMRDTEHTNHRNG